MPANDRADVTARSGAMGMLFVVGASLALAAAGLLLALGMSLFVA